MVQHQKYYRLGESTGLYAYNAVAPGPRIDLVQLATIYQTGPGQIRYYDFDKEIPRVAHFYSTIEEYINLFAFQDDADLPPRLGTPKYLMSPCQGGYENGRYWRREVSLRRDVFVDEREELEPSGSPVSDPFQPDPVDLRFLSPDSNVYQHHFDVPMFKYLTPIHDDFKAAHPRKASCCDQVLEAVIVDTASSLVTAEAVRFALQVVSPMASMCINTSVDSKQTLRPAVSRSLTDTLSVQGSATSALSSLLGESRSPTRRAGESPRELVSSTTAWPLVPVESKHID